MAKSKYAPALFEVMNSQRTGKSPSRLNLPKWFKNLRKPDATTEEPAPNTESQDPIEQEVMTPPGLMETTAEPQEVAAPALQTPQMPTPAEPSMYATIDQISEPVADVVHPPVPAKPVELPSPLWRGGSPTTTKGIDLFGEMEARPIFRADSGRIEISLNATSAAVAAGVLLLALFTSFQLGRGFAPDEKAVVQTQAGDSVEATLNRPPNAGPLNVGGSTAGTASGAGAAGAGSVAAGADAGAAAATAGDLNPELNYVILDNYDQNRNAAEFVQKWLAETHGINALLKVKGGKFVLISAAGFNLKDEADSKKCDEFIARIKTLGPDCMKELGKEKLPRYGFTEPFAARLKG